MRCLTDTGLVFPYIGGVAKQQMAVVVNFRKHQRINRPQRQAAAAVGGRLQTREMYARRDRPASCAAARSRDGSSATTTTTWPSTTSVRSPPGALITLPTSAPHTRRRAVASRRGSRDGDEFDPPQSLAGLEGSLNESANRSVNDSVNESHAPSNFEADTGTHGDFSSLNHSLTEGEGREEQGREGKPPYPPAVVRQPRRRADGREGHRRPDDRRLPRAVRPRQLLQTPHSANHDRGRARQRHRCQRAMASN